MFLAGAYYQGGSIAYTGYVGISFSSTGISGTYSAYGDLSSAVEKVTPSGTHYYVQMMNGMFPVSTDGNRIRYNYNGSSSDNSFTYVFNSNAIFVDGVDSEFEGNQTLINNIYSLIDAMYDEYYNI